MKYLIKALTTNNRELKTSLICQIEDKYYLFNCPDGFQRLALNQKLKFGKVRCVFLSSLHPDYYGGFPGFYLSSREAHIDLTQFKVSVFGPKSLQSLLVQSTSFFGSLNNVNIFEYGQMNRYLTQKGTKLIYKQYLTPEMRALAQTQNLAQQARPEVNINGINQPATQEESKSEIEESKTDEENRQAFEDEHIKIIPVQAKGHGRNVDTYSFICLPKQAKGRFLPKVAQDLGCEPKAHFRLLSDGIPVTLENGDIVHPFQVIENPTPSQSFILVFLPSENYLDYFLSEESLSQYAPYFSDNIDSQKEQIHLIYHSTTLPVLLNPEYRKFIYKFGLNVRHIIDCAETNDEVMAKVKSFNHLMKVKQVCPSLIPLSCDALRNYEEETKEQLTDYLQDLVFYNSKIGLSYNLYPLGSQGLDLSAVISHQEIDNELEKQMRFEVRQTVKSMLSLQNVKYKEQFKYEDIFELNTNEIDPSEPSILFLGTVSMKPTQYRSASAIYLFIKGFGILMDCAEGSYGQIYDHFRTKERIDEALLKLKVVFITHLHGDHQLGIIKIMAEREKLFKEVDLHNKLYVVIPAPMLDLIETIRTTILTYPEMVVIVPSNELNPEPYSYYGDETKRKINPLKCEQRSLEQVNERIHNHRPKSEGAFEMMRVLGETMNVDKLLAVEVDHCIESYGCLVQSPDFGRILYSGDTRPCQNLINYGQRVRVLIHEATFENNLSQDAHWKMHTTMSQAIDVANKCQAWRTILTHFSPRYAKIADIYDEHIENKVLVAFDHMRIKISYLEWAYRFLDIYRRLFKNDESEDQQEANLQMGTIGIMTKSQQKQDKAKQMKKKKNK